MVKRDAISAAIFSLFTFSLCGYCYIGQKKRMIWGLIYSLILFAILLVLVFIIPEIIIIAFWILVVIVWIICCCVPFIVAIILTVLCIVPCCLPLCVICCIPPLICCTCCSACWFCVAMWWPFMAFVAYTIFFLWISGPAWFIFMLPFVLGFLSYIVASIPFTIDIFLLVEKKKDEEIGDNDLGISLLGMLPGFKAPKAE